MLRHAPQKGPHMSKVVVILAVTLQPSLHGLIIQNSAQACPPCAKKIAFVTAPNWLNSSCSGSHRRLVCCPTCICTSKSLTHKSSCVKSCGMPPTKTFRTWHKFDHKHERTDLGREGVSLRRWDCPVPLKVLHTHGNGKTRALSSIAY